jgi:hypothetical protein
VLGTCGCTLQQLQLGLESEEDTGLLAAGSPGSVCPLSGEHQDRAGQGWAGQGRAGQGWKMGPPTHVNKLSSRFRMRT